MTANCKTGVASQGHQTQIDSSMNLVFTILSCDIPVELDTIRWYRKYSRNTTKKVVQYLLLRQGPKHVVLVINTTPPYQLCFDCTSCTILLIFTSIYRLLARGRVLRSGGQSGPPVYFNPHIGLYFIYLSIYPSCLEKLKLYQAF